MKYKTKIKSLIALIFALMLIFSITASANDDAASEEHPAEITEEGTEAAAEDLSEENIFNEIYARLTENADKIFAALAFAGTVLVSFAYRKGLLPMLSGALSALKSAVDGMKDEESKWTKSTDGKIALLSDGLREVRDTSDSTRESVSAMGDRLYTLEEAARQYESTRVILSSQIDMLYAIFMTSALPEYQKEEVCTKINSMREELTKHEKDKE